jgi:hypothetical protein
MRRQLLENEIHTNWRAGHDKPQALPDICAKSRGTAVRIIEGRALRFQRAGHLPPRTKKRCRMTCECGECWDLPGEIVVHRLWKWKGIIVEERDNYRWLTVRFMIPGTGLVQLEVSRFEVEPDFEEDDGGVEADKPEEDNVIPVDFTKKEKLTKNTKTRGVA